MKWLCIIWSLALTSCAWMSSPSLYQDVRINPPTKVVVRDLFSGDTLEQRTKSDDTSSFTVISLRKGLRHALSFSTDSTIAYRTTGLVINDFGWFNVFNYGVGCLVDQVTGSAYYTRPVALSKFSFAKRTEDERKSDADSVTDFERYRFTESMIDRRTNHLVTLFVNFGWSGTSNYTLPFFNSGSYGIGYSPVPYAMLLYEATGAHNAAEYTHDTVYAWYDIGRTAHSLGICLQEPHYGLFGAWRYSLGNLNFNPQNDSSDYPSFNTATTGYALSVGLYGQWGRVEYRYTRITSSATTSPIYNFDTIYNGVFWTFNVVL